MLFSTILFLAGCSAQPTTSQVAAQSSTIGSGGGGSLILSASTTSPATGAPVTLTAQNGSSPYSFFIQSGAGTLATGANHAYSPSTTYTAPSSAQTVTVGVQDSTGTSAYLVLTVGTGSGSGTLTVTPNGKSFPESIPIPFSASGGNGSYTFTVLSGGGSFTANSYKPLAVDGAVTVQATDTAGASGTATITIQGGGAGGLSITSPVNGASIPTGQAVPFTATGGTSPYTFQVLNGGPGSFSGASYTAPLGASGSVTVQVTDFVGAVGTTATYTLGGSGTYSTAIVGDSFTLTVDQYLTFSYDATGSSDHPNLFFFGTGPAADATSVGLNDPSSCFQGGVFGSAVPCSRTSALTNISISTPAPVAYIGHVSIHGTRTNQAASYDFCIAPGDVTTAYLRANSGQGFVQSVLFDYPGRALFNGQYARTAYACADCGVGGAGGASVVFSGAYSTSSSCTGFDPNQYIRVGN